MQLKRNSYILIIWEFYSYKKYNIIRIIDKKILIWYYSFKLELLKVGDAKMEDKKIKIVNIIFLIFTIIYTLYSFIFSFNIYSEGLIFGIGTRLYLIGFIIFAICQIRNEKKEIGLKIFTISTIISTTLTILNVIIYILSPYGYAFLEFIETAVMIVDIAQKIVLTIVLILIFKQKSSRILGYILLGITFILNIIMLCQEITIDYCLLAVVKGYIAVYIYYFEKGN